MKKYQIQGKEFSLREKATFGQVKSCLSLLKTLDVGEKDSLIDIVMKLGDDMGSFMQVIFDNQLELAIDVVWGEVDFDTVSEVIGDFLSSSTQLQKGLSKFLTIFHSMAKIILPENSGQEPSDGTQPSSEPPKEAGSRAGGS